MRRIAAAAIIYEGVLYTVPPPGRHHHVIRLIVETTGVRYVGRSWQGFIDDTGRSARRELFSENLW